MDKNLHVEENNLDWKKNKYKYFLFKIDTKVSGGSKSGK